MKYSKNYGLKLPESDDYYNVEDFNENAEAVDTALADALSKSEGGTVSGNIKFEGAVEGNLTGNADTATTAETAEKLGSRSIGTNTAPVYLNSGSPVACSMATQSRAFDAIPYVSSGGVMEVGRYIDFHLTSDGGNDYDTRLSCTESGGLKSTGAIEGSFSGSLTGNADTATALKTARTIQTDLASTSSVSFDGSANVTPGVTGVLPLTNGGTGGRLGS